MVLIVPNWPMLILATSGWDGLILARHDPGSGRNGELRLNRVAALVLTGLTDFDPCSDLLVGPGPGPD